MSVIANLNSTVAFLAKLQKKALRKNYLDLFQL